MSVDLGELQEFPIVLSLSEPTGGCLELPLLVVLPSPSLRTSVLNKEFHVTSHSANSGLRAIVRTGEEGGR